MKTTRILLRPTNSRFEFFQLEIRCIKTVQCLFFASVSKESFVGQSLSDLRYQTGSQDSLQTACRKAAGKRASAYAASYHRRPSLPPVSRLRLVGSAIVPIFSVFTAAICREKRKKKKSTPVIRRLYLSICARTPLQYILQVLLPPQADKRPCIARLSLRSGT